MRISGSFFVRSIIQEFWHLIKISDKKSQKFEIWNFEKVMVFCPRGLDWKEREFLSSFLKPSDGKLGPQLFVPDSFIESQRKINNLLKSTKKTSLGLNLTLELLYQAKKIKTKI